MTTRRDVSPETVQLRWFLAALAGYASVCLIFGWVRVPLFLGVGEDGWPPPSIGELAYLLYMTCLPVALWLLLAYAVARRMPGNWGMGTLLVAILVVLTVIELDHAWYGMSGHHATWREARLFLSEDWKLHYGIRDSDEYWFLERMSLHAIGLALVFYAARIGARWQRGRRGFSPPFRRALLIVVVLVCVDVLAAGYAVSRGHDQWQAVADANPFRSNTLDHLATRLFSYGSEHNADLEDANRAFSLATRDAMNPVPGVNAVFRDASTGPHQRYNVIVVTIEGLNPRLIDSTTMPFWTQLAARSTLLHNHYSTGNVTEYGVLGVLFGAPPDFYRGTLTVPWRRQLPSSQKPSQPGSLYVSDFTQHGYKTRLISWELTSWANLGVYLRNFTEPPFETHDDWKLLPVLSRELATAGPHLVYMHYNGTHFPYDHGAAYERFRPEVPADYDYASWRMRSQAEQITNRYRNCLLELDSWLRAFAGTIDMNNTIVVLTGDHGEEFFEHSRLGHASTLAAPQIRTVALIYVPGRPPRTINAVTSHADLMPTLMDLLGWQQPMAPFGHSLVGDVQSGAAIVAMGNRPNPPSRWAAVAGGLKSVLVEGAGDTLRIVQLLDTADHRVSYGADPALWRESFAAAARLQLHLRSASHQIPTANVRVATP